MNLLLNRKKRENSKTGKKIVVFLLAFIFIFSILVVPIKPAKAGVPVVDIPAAIWEKITDAAEKLWKKGGSLAFQQTLRSALNKIAYDTATYIGSGGEGQKPLFVTQDWGSYLVQVGDEAAGEFLEKFSKNLSESTWADCNDKSTACMDQCNKMPSTISDYAVGPGKIGLQRTEVQNEAKIKCVNDCQEKHGDCGSADGSNTSPSFNVCQPSSLEAKLKISLGLAGQTRPQGPDCTATQMVQNWGDAAQKYRDFKDPYFLNKFKGIFDPRSNDLGIYMLARTDMSDKKAEKKLSTKVQLSANEGWLQKLDIAGNTTSLPNQAKMEAEGAYDQYAQNFSKYTGDAFVDAANVFLNQLALSSYKKLMQNLGKSVNEDGNIASSGDYESDPSVGTGETALSEVTASIIQPNFGVRTDYDILSELSVCIDQDNPKPTNCVMDNRLMQGITEKRTVAEAIEGGHLNGGWQLTEDTRENSYSLRNISIMRKYRILPIGWEIAIQRAYKDLDNIKQVTLNDLVSCYAPGDKYYNFSADFDRNNTAWCQGLVDPNWVLKAPLNYCKKEGVGSQILDTQIIPRQENSNGFNTLSSLSLVRAENYCADNQTCIKERADGSCEVYGYCNEERRTWRFGSDSCDPIYNTCQGFVNSNNNQKVSYLENTLEYGDCNIENAGCKQYALAGSFNLNNNTVDWSEANSAYFNKNVETCSTDADGCSHLLRVKPTWGGNLIMDSDFEYEEIGDYSTGSSLNGWPFWTSGNSKKASIIDVDLELNRGSGKALKLEATGPSGEELALGTFSDHQHSLLPDGLEIIPGQSYTLSVEVYLTKGDKVHAVIGSDDYKAAEGITKKHSWRYISVTRTSDDIFNEPNFSVVAYSNSGEATFYVRNIKFEMSDWATDYSSYGSNSIYERLIPNYLAEACYENIYSANKDYRLKVDAPSQCYNYARKCNKDEVGCELFVSQSDGFGIPAQTQNEDYCPGECVGYDMYVSRITNFNVAQSENLIPNTAKKCNAEVVGCSEFTNLDQLSQGGESREYYTSLKHCIKPGQGNCGNFYAWEGTGSGYQLRVYTLQQDSYGDLVTTSEARGVCTEEIYNLSVDDPGYNPDCRELYSQSGEIFYHLNSNIITCSDNCHAYRLSENDVDRSLSYSECVGDDKHWDTVNGSCSVCLSGGTWDDSHEACIYQAVPGEGKTCSAVDNGCREYNGSNGNNTKLLAYENFENGQGAWYSNCSDGLSISEVANNKEGHSVLYNENANNCGAVGGDDPIGRLRFIKEIFAADDVAMQMDASNLVTQDKAYNVKFLAKADKNTKLNIYLYNPATKDKALFGNVEVSGDNNWQMYQSNLENLDHDVASSEKLVITADNDFYFDSVVLTEITDRYYLIKKSSQIPEICYYDTSDEYQGANYNLGCSAYIDRNNNVHNLHKFSSLCSDSAVGCEQMIDTKNYSPHNEGIWSDLDDDGACDTDEEDCVKVSGDSAMYAVYDPLKQCHSSDKGCSLVGQGQESNNNIVWSDIFVRNNPDRYDEILCSQSVVGCEEWKDTQGGLSYFKNPGSDVCAYRYSQDSEIAGKAWYKAPVKRCDSNGNGEISGSEEGTLVCIDDNDCDDDKCIVDNNDYPCSVSYLKTIGLGGGGNQIPTPDRDVALCEASAATCTEYIDPVSQFSPNLIYNPGYELINNNPEGWGTFNEIYWRNPDNPDVGANQQVVQLERNKLYVLNSESEDSSEVSIEFLFGAKELLNDNTFDVTKTELSIDGDSHHITFNSLSNAKALISGGQLERVVSLKEVVIDYQLKENIDNTSCNLKVDFDGGCVLFNERKMNGGQGLISLENSWDAYSSDDKKSPKKCDSDEPGSCNVNQLIKVRPDRVCAKWLDCVTYVEDPDTGERTCYAVGECNKLNDNNECSNFADIDDFQVVGSDEGGIGNVSGYAFINKYNLNQMKEVGLNSDVHYDFEELIPALNCLRFDGRECSFSENIVKDSVVREPEGAPTDYPAHGESYLQVPASYRIAPHSRETNIVLAENTDYFINYLINTKDSRLKTKLNIVFYDSESNLEIPNTAVSFSDTANSGWERKIRPFSTPILPPNSSGSVNIQITLGASDSDANNEGFVYFDDINIEPVLEIAPGKYVSRECRLYPTSDSLTCFNKNDNVIKDGLEGYCLEYDSSNPSVCLNWYPVDKIVSATTGRGNLGYQGQFPLHYCTAVNNDFEIVEKRQPFLIKSFLTEREEGNDGCTKWEKRGIIPTDGFHENEGDFSICGTDYIGFSYNERYYISSLSGHQHCSVDYWCVPNREGNVKVLVQERSGSVDFETVKEYNKSSYGKFVYAVPEGDYSEGAVRQESGDKGEYIGEHQARIFVEDTSGWYEHNGIDATNKKEFELADPAIRVYEYKEGYSPANEDGLKWISGDDPDKVFRLTCDSFVQVADSSGDNKAWASRTGFQSDWPYETPPYFVDKISNSYKYYGNEEFGETYYGIRLYGRNREALPFGATIWPDNFDLLSSERVKLKDQYSDKNREEILAGRPYGCSGDNPESCQHIGYCSLNPSVYCLYSGYSTNFEINKKTCANGGYGVCKKIWRNPLEFSDDKKDYKNVLKSLFLKSYDAYSFDYDNQMYSSSVDQGDNYNGLPEISGCTSDRPDNYTSLVGESANPFFCAVYPEIENVKLKYNGQLMGTSNPFSIPKKGVYSLEFNTIIDKEQQPLKEIYINWGDGTEQIVTGQDNRPSVSNPHVVYHYYRETGNNKTIKISVYDNWGFYGSCMSGRCYLPPYHYEY